MLRCRYNRRTKTSFGPAYTLKVESACEAKDFQYQGRVRSLFIGRRFDESALLKHNFTRSTRPRVAVLSELEDRFDLI